MAEKGESLKGRVAALAGCGPLTRMVAGPLRLAGAALLWASKNRELVQSTSQTFGGRQAIWEAIYTTGHEVLVLGRDGGSPVSPADNDVGLHPGYLKPGMTVVDLLANESSSRFLEAAADRGCRVISPGAILVEQIRDHVRRLGGDVPLQILSDRLAKQEWGST